ncbi:MAG: sulfatase [Puniceicoccaceae bacterium]
MNINAFLNKSCCLFGALFVLTNGLIAGLERPNIVFILADDMGQTQLGCYGGPYETPNLDKFCKQGMKFENAYSSAAVCSPTRAAIMTGKYPARLHITDFIKGNSFPDKPLKQPNWQKFLPLSESTIGEAFKSLGYRTALFGKWHLSIEKAPPDSAPYNPDKQGFDEYMVTYKPVRRKTDPEKDPHNVDAITDRSIRFLNENKDHPFLLIVSHNSIHDPVMESTKRIDRYRNSKGLKEWNIIPEIAAMVNRLDEGTGRLLDAIHRLGLEQNTLVVFTGDNGGKHSYADQVPFRAGKGWLYEGGIRAPLLVRLPGVIDEGSKSELVVSSIDFLPTFLEGVGETAPSAIDGRSFWGELTGEEGISSKPLFWHYPHYHGGSGMRPASAMLKGKYKLIEWHEALLTGSGNAYELYDLNEDVGETHNLVDTLPDVFRDMRKGLSEWKRRVGAQMPTVR